MNLVRLVVTLDEATSFSDVTKSLQSSGMDIEKVDDFFGLAFGQADTGALPDLRQLPGVDDVRVEQAVSLPPMSENIPQ